MNNNTPPPIIIIKLKSNPSLSVTEDLIFDNYSGTYFVIVLVNYSGNFIISPKIFYIYIN